MIRKQYDKNIKMIADYLYKYSYFVNSYWVLDKLSFEKKLLKIEF